MPRICYVDKRFSEDHLGIIGQANSIIDDLRARGYVLTLRQLYYQFVSKDWVPNTQQSYKRLGGIVNDARLAGLIDWQAIVDRTRNLEDLSHWDRPEEMVGSAAAQFRVEMWANQPHYVEVWIEKDALVGVIERPCEDLDVPYFSCRGYTSQSELWGAARRFIRHRNQDCVIVHLGDHDPSGKDMTRDITDRMALFGAQVTVDRIALNMDQIERYGPPPNPAKLSDSRAGAYCAEFGDDSWELDALDPDMMAELVSETVKDLIDDDQWTDDLERLTVGRQKLRAVEDRMEQLLEDVDLVDYEADTEEGIVSR